MPASARVLLSGAVDFAGLFPPAALGMAEAVAEYVQCRGSENRWALGRFVVPATRLDEFGQAARAEALLPTTEQVVLSALVGADVDADHRAIQRFHQGHRALGAVVDSVECRGDTVATVRDRAARFADQGACWIEVPLTEELPALLDAMGGTRARPKIRMGGIEASAFPGAEQVVRFLGEVVGRSLVYKATAGLHHTVRGEYRLSYAADSAVGGMHGYLNLLLATALLQAGGEAGQACELLLTADRAAFRLDDSGATWRGHHFPLTALRQAREGGLLAFGSCSFREPLSDLEQVVAS